MIPCFEDMTQKTFCGLHFGNDWSNSVTPSQLIGYDLLGTAILVGSILGTIWFFIRRENHNRPSRHGVEQ